MFQEGGITRMAKIMAKRVPWSRDELLVAFRLYCRTPFGKLHRHNPEIVELSRVLGRTPSAVAMKACNFASLDPVQRARSISALGNVSQSDREVWEAFEASPEALAADAEAAYVRLTGRETPPLDAEDELDLPEGETEAARMVRIRRVQGFFRATILASYEYRCALSDIAVPQLLNASHIIPWKISTTRRADPRNGILLNTFYDRAFDRGLITFDESLRLVIPRRLRTELPPAFQRQTLLELAGTPLRLPCRFAPDPVALTYHREHVFA
jgi:putative restriction endonuclease